MKRKSLSKGLRFDIFKRDAFTCQYCGRRPPEVILEVDHITPVAEGGMNDQLNLVTACGACNAGKGKKLLDRPQRPDADLAWLEAQQELAELRRYQEAKQERDGLIDEIVTALQDRWITITGLEWAPHTRELQRMLTLHSPDVVENALDSVAIKVAGGYISKHGDHWLRYTWGILHRAKDMDDAQQAHD